MKKEELELFAREAALNVELDEHLGIANTRNQGQEIAVMGIPARPYGQKMVKLNLIRHEIGITVLSRGWSKKVKLVSPQWMATKNYWVYGCQKMKVPNSGLMCSRNFKTVA